MSTLTHEDKLILVLFKQKLADLLASPVVASPKPELFSKLHVVMGDNPKITSEFAGHDKYIFDSFVLTFRQLTMKDEEVRIDNVCKIVVDYCDREDLKDIVRDAKQQWDDIWNGPPAIKFEIEGKSYSNRKIVKLWMYGGVFHTDIDKAVLWWTLGTPIRNDILLSIHSLLPALVRHVKAIGDVVDEWLK